MTGVAATLIRLAFVLGLVHSAFSAYWALGGRWLLNTVGQWATDLATTQPGVAFWGLLLIAVFKVAAAVIPLLNAQGRMPWPKIWRSISWIGGIFLVLYGGFNMIVAWAVLGGVIYSGDFNRPAMLGHAALWDPLFFLWGAALSAHLWLTRRSKTPLR